jgi:hypothetical protein
MATTAPQVIEGLSAESVGKLYTRKRRHRIIYPKSYDPTRTVQTVPDPHRWLPRSQRPGQSRRRAPGGGPSFIKGPQGLVSTEERKAAGPSTAHIDLGSGPKASSGKSTKSKRR